MPNDSVFYGYDLGGADTEPKEENNEPEEKGKEAIHKRIQSKGRQETGGRQEEESSSHD